MKALEGTRNTFSSQLHDKALKVPTWPQNSTGLNPIKQPRNKLAKSDPWRPHRTQTKRCWRWSVYTICVMYRVGEGEVGGCRGGAWRTVDWGAAGRGGCIMTAKELFCWALSRESLVCCIRAGSALAYSRHREKVCLRSSCTFVFVWGKCSCFQRTSQQCGCSLTGLTSREWHRAPACNKTA